jgi:putative nucleotidyltransferase with HDIG domain
MIRHKQISMHRLVLSLSDALDYVCPKIADHQHRVTYIALSIAKQLGFSRMDLEDLFLGAALHDIGMIHAGNKVDNLLEPQSEQNDWHTETGYELLRCHELFTQAAPIIRHHHTPWNHGCGSHWNEEPIPIGSHIIHLADWIDQSINPKVNILHQSEDLISRICRKKHDEFHPDCVEAFLALAPTESFWLDCISHRMYSVLMQILDETLVQATDDTIQSIAVIFARMVDAMSRWTATHTAGVTATAVALADFMRFSLREQIYMRTAGLLHDLGKLSVPSHILDKPGPLTEQEWAWVKCHTYHTFRILETTGFPQQIIEWAAFHHERLDGKGYPFQHKGKNLTLGSRILAVADTYTALAEDRPYRAGVPPKKAVEIMFSMAVNGALDGDVVSMLERNLDRINHSRRQEQNLYAERQEILTAITSLEKALVP